MTTELMQEILKMLDKKMITEDRNVLLFLDNAPCHPDTLQNGLKNIKLEYFPKNTTSRLQPCDAGIIRSFKQKNRKRLVRFIVARIYHIGYHMVVHKKLKSDVEISTNRRKEKRRNFLIEIGKHIISTNQLRLYYAWSV